MTPTKTLSAMLYELADDLVVAGLIDNSAEVEQAAERLDTLTVTIRGLETQRDMLIEAAQAVIDRWDSPLWKDLPHTAESINALRAAIACVKETK